MILAFRSRVCFWKSRRVITISFDNRNRDYVLLLVEKFAASLIHIEASSIELSQLIVSDTAEGYLV